jgi:hypothetical protein
MSRSSYVPGDLENFEISRYDSLLSPFTRWTPPGDQLTSVSTSHDGVYNDAPIRSPSRLTVRQNTNKIKYSIVV